MGWKRLGATALVLALGLAACGGETPSERAQRTDQNKEQSESDSKFEVVLNENATGPAPEIEGAQEGGTITVLTASEPDTFDPTRAYYIDTLAVLRLTNRTLTTLSLREDGTYELVPDIAEGLGTPNDDFTEWKFTLKEGIKYEDGTPVTSADIAYAAKRSFAVEELPGGATYQQTYFLDGEKYKGPYKSKAQGGGPDYAGVETPDDRTIIFKMRKPFPDLPYYLTFPIFSPIMESKDGSPQAYGNHPMATGPYKFESFQPGRQLVLTRNEHWDPQTDPSRHQYPDKFVFKYGQDPLKLQEQLIADQGQDQTAITYDDVPASLLPKVIGKEPENRLIKGLGTCTIFIYLDTRKMPLEVRKALYTAWPFDALHKAAQDNPLSYEPATTILPPSIPDWKKFDVMGTGGKGNGDPEKARKMLEESGNLGFEVVWVFEQGEPISEKVSATRKQFLEKAGFKVRAIPMAGDKIRDELDDPNSEINIRPLGWCSDWPSATSWFPAIFDGRLIEQNPNSAPVKHFLNEDEINNEIDRIGALPIEEQSVEWQKLDRMIMEKYLPVIPVQYSKTAILHGSKVGGVQFDAYAGAADWSKLYVKQ